MSVRGTTTLLDPPPPAADPIPLPETRRVSRARQRRRQQARRRRRAAMVTVTAVATVLAVGGSNLTRALPGRPGRPRTTGPPARRPGPPSPLVVPPVLVAQQGPTGSATSLTVVVPSATGRGGTVVLVPPGTMAEVVSLGLEPVGRSLELGGPSRLQATMENLLGVALGGVATVDDDALAAWLAPLGPLTVQVPSRVEQVQDGGRVDVLYEAGPAQVAPTDAARFLSAPGRGSDLERLARHQAFFDAWLARLRQDRAAAPAQPPALARVFAALLAGPVRTRVVPVDAMGPGGPDAELYKVRGDELARMVAAVFPSAGRPGAHERPRLQILNGTGVVGLADEVRARLGPGFDVRLTGNAASFDHERTEVVFYDRSRQPVAERVLRALGVGTLVLSRRPFDVVDVTVVVGKDFRTG